MTFLTPKNSSSSVTERDRLKPMSSIKDTILRIFGSVEILNGICKYALGGLKPPPLWHPPVAIVPYYLQHKDATMGVSCAGNTKASRTPPPPLGAGWRKGVCTSKKVFFRVGKFTPSRTVCS